MFVSELIYELIWKQPVCFRTDGLPRASGGAVLRDLGDTGRAEPGVLRVWGMSPKRSWVW
jgi:hypothetical protein